MNSHQRKVFADQFKTIVEEVLRRLKLPEADTANNLRDQKDIRASAVTLIAFWVTAFIGYLGTAGIIEMTTALLLLFMMWAIGAWGFYDLAWRRKSKRSAIVGVVAVSLFVVALHMGVLHWRTTQRLKKAQNDTYRFLSSTANIPPTKTHPYSTYFAVVNSGGSTIGNYDMYCKVNAEVSSAGVNTFPNGIGLGAQFYSGPINGTGDSSESDPCLVMAHAINRATRDDDQPRCVDVSLTVNYALKEQPNLKQCKMFRYAAMSDGDKYFWVTESINMKRGVCYSYLNPENQEKYDKSTSKLQEGGECNQEKEQ